MYYITKSFTKHVPNLKRIGLMPGGTDSERSHVYFACSSHFWKLFFSNPPKMALFGLNWEESKWPGHFSSTFLNFFASKIGVKLPPKKKVPWYRCWALLSSRWKSHFSQKNAFFGQKKAFFQKVLFIQIWSVTPNIIFECIKNDFLLSNPKLVFFTEFNLPIPIYVYVFICN